MKKYIIILTVLFLNGAYSLDNDSLNFEDYSPDINQILKNWKIDSLGCKHLRTVRDAYYVIDSLFYTGFSDSNLVDVFGTPDDIWLGIVKGVDSVTMDWIIDSTKYIWGYYIESNCKGNKIDSTYPYMFILKFIIKDNILIDYSVRSVL